MATIELRHTKTGLTRFRVRFRSSACWESKTFDTREEAEAYRTLTGKRIKDGRVLYGDPDLSQCLEEYCRFRHTLASSTKRGYQAAINFVANLLPVKAVTDLKEFHVRDLVIQLSTKLGLGTARQYYRTFQAIIHFCIKEQLLESDPTSDVRAPKPPDLLPRALSDQEVSALEDANQEDMLLDLLLRIALATGMRIGEIACLRLSQIDLHSSEIKLLAEQTKTRTPRTIPIGPYLLEPLRRYISRLPKSASGTDPLLFPPVRAGAPRRYLYSLWLKMKKNAQLQGYRFHDLRHTFAVRLLRMGVHIHTISILLGHKNIKTTTTYLRLEITDLKNAVQKAVPGEKWSEQPTKDPDRKSFPDAPASKCPKCANHLDAPKAPDNDSTMAQELGEAFFKAVRAAVKSAPQPSDGTPAILEFQVICKGESPPDHVHAENSGEFSVSFKIGQKTGARGSPQVHA